MEKVPLQIRARIIAVLLTHSWSKVFGKFILSANSEPNSIRVRSGLFYQSSSKE